MVRHVPAPLGYCGGNSGHGYVHTTGKWGRPGGVPCGTRRKARPSRGKCGRATGENAERSQLAAPQAEGGAKQSRPSLSGRSEAIAPSPGHRLWRQARGKTSPLYPVIGIVLVGIIMTLLTLNWQREHSINGIDAVLSAVSVGIVAVAVLITAGAVIALAF